MVTNWSLPRLSKLAPSCTRQRRKTNGRPGYYKNNLYFAVSFTRALILEKLSSLNLHSYFVVLTLVSLSTKCYRCKLSFSHDCWRSNPKRFATPMTLRFSPKDYDFIRKDLRLWYHYDFLRETPKFSPIVSDDFTTSMTLRFSPTDNEILSDSKSEMTYDVNDITKTQWSWINFNPFLFFFGLFTLFLCLLNLQIRNCHFWSTIHKLNLACCALC